MLLIINGILLPSDDEVSKKLFDKQQKASSDMPVRLKEMHVVQIPLRAYNIMGLENIRSFLSDDYYAIKSEKIASDYIPHLKNVIEDIYNTSKKVIFTMGKGGVGKTTVAAAIPLGLAEKGVKVHLTTTEPAAHLKNVIDEQPNISISHIDEHEVLEKYKETVLEKAGENNMSADDIAYIEEDLHREDWGPNDPTGKSDVEFERTIKEIHSKIEDLRERIINNSL